MFGYNIAKVKVDNVRDGDFVGGTRPACDGFGMLPADMGD
jgi:hypothetical protein